MKNLKKTRVCSNIYNKIFFLITLIILPSLNSFRASEIINIGIEKHRPPFIYKNTTLNKIDDNSLMIKWLNTLCLNMNVTCKYSFKYFSLLLDELKYDELDTVILIDQVVDTTNNNVRLSYQYCFLEPKLIKYKEKNIENIKNINIAVLKDSHFEDFLLKNISKFKFKFNIISYASLDAAFFDLIVKRVNFVFTNKNIAEKYILSKEIGNKFVFLDNIEFVASINILDDFFRNKGMQFLVKDSNSSLLYKIDVAAENFLKNKGCSIK